jgi:hypothetical protein
MGLLYLYLYSIPEDVEDIQMCAVATIADNLPFLSLVKLQQKSAAQ